MNWNTFCKFLMSLFILCFFNYCYAENSDINDSAIDKSIVHKISTERSLAGLTISVSTSKGVVRLSGSVDSDTQASTLTELAQSTPGVTDVNTDNLTIKESDQPMADAYITAKVKGMFIQQKLFGDKDISAMSISVETNNGIVSLSGTADNQAQIENAIKITKKVSGVKEVKSTVQISGTNISNSK